MSSVKQYQRRALEALKPHQEKPFQIFKDDEARYYISDERFCLNGKRIYLLGISIGVGTCADLHGVYIAVFSREKPSSSFSPRFPLGQNTVSCQWAALLRGPNKEELEEWHGEQAGDCLVVEELKFSRSFQDHMLFALTEKKVLYSDTI